MVSAILLLGGSASISALTGMDIRAATMLLPIGVIAFVVVGGLRSTFVSDFVVRLIILSLHTIPNHYSLAHNDGIRHYMDLPLHSRFANLIPINLISD